MNGRQELPAELTDRELVELLFCKVSELERLLLTFRQTQLMLLGMSEEVLQLPRSVLPKNKR